MAPDSFFKTSFLRRRAIHQVRHYSQHYFDALGSDHAHYDALGSGHAHYDALGSDLATTLHTTLFLAVGSDPAVIRRSWLRPCMPFFAVGSDPAHIQIIRSWLRPCMLLIAIGFDLANTITITRFPFSS